jgi:hypothetical protein
VRSPAGQGSISSQQFVDDQDQNVADHIPSSECNLIVEADIQSPQQRDDELSPTDECRPETGSINESTAVNVFHRQQLFNLVNMLTANQWPTSTYKP